MELNKIYNEDCFDTMQRMVSNEQKVNIILTSPPYCTPNDDASKYNESRFNNYQVYYDVFTGFDTPEQYIDWSVKLFNSYNDVLCKNGVVLYNLSYTSSNPDLIYRVVSTILKETEFTIADTIVWKKNSALPQNQNSNRLTRVCEFIFVFCRKSELLTFLTNKSRVSNKYTCFNNFIVAANNDLGVQKYNKLNGATFSSDLVLQLLNIYAKPKCIVYDSFMGTGTTACACKQYGCYFIGSEISSAQVEFANKRLQGVRILSGSKIKNLW